MFRAPDGAMWSHASLLWRRAYVSCRRSGSRRTRSTISSGISSTISRNCSATSGTPTRATACAPTCGSDRRRTHRSQWKLYLNLQDVCVNEKASDGDAHHLSALEQDGVRLSLSLGTESRLSGALDMLARTSGGTYVGAGLVVDRLDDSSYNSTSSSDTTVVTRPHDHGRHLGDHHVRHGRTVTSTSSALSVLSVGGTDLALTPSLSIGMAARHGLFLESRVLFSGGDASNRTSVGVRF